MVPQYMAIDTDVTTHNKQKEIWVDRGIAAVRANSMSEGIEFARSNAFLFIGINANTIHFMPKLNVLREVTNDPILIATSSYDAEEHAEALYNGADSYGMLGEKEISVKTTLAVLKRIEEWRGQPKCSDGLLADEDILFLEHQRVAFFENTKISLSKIETTILDCFLRKRGALLSYEEICETVYGKYDQKATNGLFNAMKRFRKKLHDIAQFDYIENVRGAGYRFMRK